MREREAGRPGGGVAEVFRAFLVLGLTSFGGPVAHLGYFREAFVLRRKWLSDAAYAELVAICQFLPGPASSQVGMAIGLSRAGHAGMFAAWLAFTLPSAILLVAFAHGAAALGPMLGSGWLAGLKAAAAAVVAHALLGMARSLAPDAPRATIAVGGMVLALLLPGPPGQILAILAGSLAGLVWLGRDETAPSADPADRFIAPVGRKAGLAWLALFLALLALLPVLATATGNAALAMADSYYRTGALVFGGGHVVLPLLQAETVDPGLVTREAFLAGYGAAQAVPGPLFTFAAYLGAVQILPPNGLAGAALALAAIFLPSALLILGALPFWEILQKAPRTRHALQGINAAVVGLLAAALYDPVLTEGITGPRAMAVAALAFAALAFWRVPAWAIVIGASLAGAAIL